MNSSLKAAVDAFIAREKLPPAYADTVQRWFLPLAKEVLDKAAAARQALVVGISGCQGSGKSTLAGLLVVLLREMMGLKCVNLSLDDFYLTRAQRQALAQSVHPLLATRGVPGTHDVNLAIETIESLRHPGRVAIPRFNKAVDDREAPENWPQVTAPADVILFEGWCLSIGPQDEAALRQPVNELERNEDTQGTWRHYVNDTLRRNYLPLYALVEHLVMLRAPAFENVFEWRQRQEEKLAAARRDVTGSRIMPPDQLRRFIQHYERLTRHGLQTLPEKADTVFELTGEQTIAGRRETRDFTTKSTKDTKNEMQ